jgi:hypothetical protein
MINSFQDITTAAQTITTAIALVTPQANVGYRAQSLTGSLLPTLLFHTEGENVAHLQSDITDHYTEINSAIQDQIALKPEEVTVHGCIGELNDVFPVGTPINPTITATLLAVQSFIPAFTTSGQAAIDSAAAGYLTAQTAQDAVVSIWGGLSGNSTNTVIGSSGITIAGVGQNLQQTMFQQFYLYWKNRTLFTIQTPWAVFTNMAILELRAVQDDTTRMITDFYISFKLLRFSSTTETVVAPQAIDRAATAAMPIVYNGNNTGSSTSTTVQDLQNNISPPITGTTP